MGQHDLARNNGEDGVDDEGDSEMVRSKPVRPEGARNEAQMGAGPALTVRADGMRSLADGAARGTRPGPRGGDFLRSAHAIVSLGRGEMAEAGRSCAPMMARIKDAISICSAVRTSTSSWQCWKGLKKREGRGGAVGASPLLAARIAALKPRKKRHNRNTLEQVAEWVTAGRTSPTHDKRGAEQRSRITFAFSGRVPVRWAKQVQEEGGPTQELLLSSDPNVTKKRTPTQSVIRGILRALGSQVPADKSPRGPLARKRTKDRPRGRSPGRREWPKKTVSYCPPAGALTQRLLE